MSEFLNKVKGPVDKPAIKRRKVDLKTKIVSKPEYLKAIQKQEVASAEKKKKKQNKTSNAKRAK